MTTPSSFCVHCGSPLPGQVGFCAKCGKPQQAASNATQQTQSQQFYQQPSQPYQYQPSQSPQQRQQMPPQYTVQSNSSGYIPAATTQRRGTPWWAWVIIGFIVVVIISAAVNAGKNSNTASNPTQQADVPPTDSGNVQPVVQPTARPVATARPIPTSSFQLVKDFQLIPAPSGAGPELVGQSGQDSNFLVTVNGVQRISEVHGDGEVFTSQGTFLLLTLDLKNISTKSQATLIFTKITDSQGRSFNTSSNYDALTKISFAQKFPTDISVEPGFTGHAFELFEIPNDSSGLKFSVGF